MSFTIKSCTFIDNKAGDNMISLVDNGPERPLTVAIAGSADADSRWAALLSAAPAEVLARQQPWVPPQQEGFGPWMEAGSTTPIPPMTICAVLLASERARRQYVHTPWDETDILPAGSFDTFLESHVAYCIKLPDPGEPTAAEVEATQTPQSPEQYVADMMADEANKRMAERDIRAPSAREAKHQYDKAMAAQTQLGAAAPAPAPEGLGVLAPIGQRVGGGRWGC